MKVHEQTHELESPTGSGLNEGLPTLQPLPQDRLYWLRFALIVEFVLALQAVLFLWSEIGGQGHMDLLPWYLKLACISLMAWFVVKCTAAAIREPKAWNRKARLWFAAAVLTGMLMGSITFYYHLHEVPEEPDADQSAAKSVRVPVLRKLVHAA